MQWINDGQRRMIFRLVRKLDLDETMRHQIIGALTDGRTPHVSELTKNEARRVVDWLMEQAGESPGRPGRRSAPGASRASAEQLWKIRQLEQALGWAAEPERLAGFIHKFARVDRLEWLTPLKASNVIEGLKAVLAKQTGGEGAALG